MFVQCVVALRNTPDCSQRLQSFVRRGAVAWKRRQLQLAPRKVGLEEFLNRSVLLDQEVRFEQFFLAPTVDDFALKAVFDV